MLYAFFFANGKRHDFRVFKESKTHVHPLVKVKTDTGFQGIADIHANSVFPIKRKSKRKFSVDEKLHNRQVASDRLLIEHVIGFIKRFRILSERYRNRRKLNGLRFSLLCGICNFDKAA